MPWNGKILFDNGKELTITTGADFWDSKLRIALSKNDLENLTDEEIIKSLRDFQEDADEIELVHLADEVGWDSNYIKPFNLLTILNSKFATDEQKRKAATLLNGEKLKRDNPPKKKEKSPGFIYLFLDHNHSMHYKIGLSIDPYRRLEQVGNATLVHFFPADDMPEAEGKLHKQFENQRTRGEWFTLYEPNIEYIQSITEYKNGEFTFQE